MARKRKTLAMLTENCYVYEAHVKYYKGYFNNPDHPLEHINQFGSTQPRTIEYVQKCFAHCTVISLKLIKAPIQFKFNKHVAS